MKAKEISEKLSRLHQAIEMVTESKASWVISELLNLIENMAADEKKLRLEIQTLKDEINRLKGEQGKPDIKPNKSDDNDDNDFSTEKERRKAESAGEIGEKEGFKLDQPTLEKLKEKDIPTEILDILYELRRKKFTNKAEFLAALEAVIGTDATARYGSLLVKYARYRKRNRNPKIPDIPINRTKRCVVDVEDLPDDAVFKGYKPKVVQDVIIQTDNILFEREVYWSPSKHKTFLGEIPVGYEKDFGPHINSRIISFKYACNMSIPKIREFYTDLGALISESYISDVLTKRLDIFHEDISELFEASLEVCEFQQIDDTGTRVNGRNWYTHIVCNEFCSIFFTTPKKNRMTIIDILRNFGPRKFVFNQETFELLEQLRVSQKWILKLRESTESDNELNEDQLEEILAELFPDTDKGKISRARITEAAAIAAYHGEIEYPIVEVLMSDDAPQFKLIVGAHMLCWVHEGRHYKKLRPLIPSHQEKLEAFRKRFWDFYRKLYEYKQAPDPQFAQSLEAEFDELFSTKTGYEKLDDRISKTRAKKKNLLVVLKHPDGPLHNNGSETGIRVEKRRSDVSFQTKTDEGTRAKDTMTSVSESCKKLGVSPHEYIYDRISGTFKLPSLAELLRKKAKSKPPHHDSS